MPEMTPQQMMDFFKKQEAEREAAIPTEREALRLMFMAEQRLKELGWRDACYCPKDGSLFNVIEFGSTGIHTAHYDGKWPKGSYWIHDNGDLWPSRPILFKLIEKPPENKVRNISDYMHEDD